LRLLKDLLLLRAQGALLFRGQEAGQVMQKIAGRRSGWDCCSQVAGQQAEQEGQPAQQKEERHGGSGESGRDESAKAPA
jgi:hypothetical protein